MYWLRWAGILLLIGVAVRGIVAISSELDGVLKVVPAIVVAVAVITRVLLGGAGWGVVVVVLSASVVALALLLGAAAFMASAVDGPVEPWLGLAIAFAVVGVGTWLYVRVWPDPWIGVPAVVVSSFAVLLLVVVPPAVAAVAGAIQGDGSVLTPEGNTGSALEVIVLRGGPQPGPGPRSTSHGWSVTTWSGQVRRSVDGPWSVQWDGGNSPPPVAAKDSDRVLLLFPDAQVEGWLQVADTVTPLSTPTFAITSASDQSRWAAALRGNGLTRRRGRPLILDPNDARTTSDLAVELAELAPTADQDLALAAQHRPALFFDSDEETPMPYNVDRLIESGKMRLCAAGPSQEIVCPEVRSADQLRRDAGRLTFDPADLGTVQQDPTVYVHVRRTGNDYREPRAGPGELIYLDYWWYFPYNPAEAGEGATCSAGFNIAGLTCFDHQSDWEGITVMLDGDSPTGSPVAALYAQHNHVHRYDWAALQEIWRPRIRAEYAHGIDTTLRPLVFVASGTHASYPFDCKRPAGAPKCATYNVPDQRRSGRVTDRGFDGKRPWGDNTTACPLTCVTPFPTRNEGKDRAGWNAFAGRWGTPDCMLGVICSESQSPFGPGEQDRYDAPWCARRAFEFAEHTWAFRDGGACENERPARSTLEQGRQRVAVLGDSFSSGQGAGNYRPGTHGGGNTCYRSDGAWPLLMAESLDLVPVAFLACSGAISDEVIYDDMAHNHEAERAMSQIGRIVKDPTAITLTIGGNDAKFAEVVEACVLPTNCKAAYDKPSGDVLDARIDRLAERLPRVYEAIMRAAPGAKLVVVDYPRLLPSGGRAEMADNCALDGRFSMSAAEVEYLNEKTERLDDAIEAAAAEAGADFVEVIDAFEGHELRCGRASFVNPARIQGGDLRRSSFHPNAAGHVQLADVIARQLATRAW